MADPVGMRVPEGAGIWIAFPSMLHKDPKGLAAMLAIAGWRWVAPRGDDPRWTKENTIACNDAGVSVYRWTYSRPTAWKKEVELAKRWKGEGDAGFIIDAEMPWEVPTNLPWFKEANLYVDALDQALGADYFIADAPWPYVGFHWALDAAGNPLRGFPFHAFARRMNARMPQSYWTEISNAGAKHHLPLIDAQWDAFDRRFPHLARPVWPIGITYGRKEMAAWGGQQLPPGEITVADVEFFDARYCGASGLSPRSYYSREAASADVLAALYAINHPTIDLGGQLSLGPATPLGWEARAEWDAREEDRAPRPVGAPARPADSRGVPTAPATPNASIASALNVFHKLDEGEQTVIISHYGRKLRP